MPPQTPEYHAFNRLVLTICDPPIGEVQSEHTIELRAIDSGAEIWRASRLHSCGEPCASELRYIGTMSSRQVIDLLTDLERSGIYEALPSSQMVPHEDVDCALVSMDLTSQAQVRNVLVDAPADAGIVRRVVHTVRSAVAMAQERALSWAG
jgi:hypothetical protein